MTITPLATAVPVPAAPAGTGEAVAPTEFLAALLAALEPSDFELSPDIEPVEMPSAEKAEAPPVILDPALAALVVQQVPVLAPRPATPDPRLVEEGAPAPVSKPNATPATPAAPSPGFETVAAQPPEPAGKLAAQLAERPTPELVVAGRTAVTKEPASVHAEAAPSSDTVPNLPATANQTSTLMPAATLASPAVATPLAPSPSPPIANTAPLERVSAQVFPEITGLVSRGNGSHRITLTLNPEQLGEVRVVMTLRDGAVHVRMAAGHEARAALLDGSPELSRLLENVGATETRIVVRELPAAALSPTTPNPNSHSSLLGGDGAPDRHAGTRADHQARDGSDPSTPRSERTDGATSPGPAPRSIQSVTGTRTAGVDVTM